MSSDDHGSVTSWIDHLKAGDQEAAQRLWERYFEKLVRLARARLIAARRRSGVEDEEDAALSVLENICAGAKEGRFPQLKDRDDLWRMLVVITARKVRDQLRRQGRKKRGGGLVLGEAALPGDGSDGAGGLDRIVGDDPTPEFAAMVAEEFQNLLGLLDGDAFRKIAVWRLEGYSNDDIARNLGCSVRTVNYKVRYIRKTWEVRGG
jgi:DNA-directed RNA polymerase specialized sigma24 family protein